MRDPANTREHRLDEILGEYLEARDAGRSIAPDELLAHHPDLASHLTTFLDDVAAVDRWTAPLRPVARAACAGAMPVPTSVASYDLLAEAGRGGWGIVYKARQRGLNRVVALKMILAGRLASADHVRRFRNEAEIVAALDHPNIVPVHEVGEWSPAPGETPVLYFTMKWFDGGSLADHLSRFTADPRGAAQVTARVAHAVHHAHQRGVLHRDLKPSNVLLDGDGEPHVADFGLARRESDSDGLTETGIPLGTPAYMAPEQVGGGDVTTAADVYGLGALLYALLTGRPPFRGPTSFDTLAAVRERDPDPVRSLNPQVDRDLETVCLKCLEKEPRRRYPSAQAVAEDLERWLKGEPVHARPVSRAMHLWRWCCRNPLSAGLLAAIMLLTAVGILLLGRERNEALRQQARAEERAATVRRLLYGADAKLAHQAWLLGNRDQMTILLERHRPEAGEEDLRGFEWYHAWHLLQGGRRRIVTSEGELYHVAFSPDGPLFVTACQNGTAMLHDATDGRRFAVCRGHRGDVNWAEFSPNGKLVATAGDDRCVRLWEVPREPTDDLAPLATLTGHTGGVVGAVFSPDGRFLASAGSDRTVRLWDVANRRELGVFPGHEGRVESLAWSPDGGTLATVGDQGSVLLWDVPEGKVRVRSHRFGAVLHGVAFAPDGKTFATAGHHGRVRLGETATGRLLRELTASHSLPVQGVAFTPDGQGIAAAVDDGCVRIWDVATGEQRDVLLEHRDRVWSLSFSPDGSTLLTCGRDRSVVRWEMAGVRPASVVVPPGTLTCFALAADDSSVVGGTSTGEIVRCHFRPPGRMTLMHRHGSPVTALAVSPDGHTVASAAADGSVKVWHSDTAGQTIVGVQAARGSRGLAFAHDWRTLALAAEGGEVHLWDVAVGKIRASLPARGGPHSPLAVSLDGRTLAVIRDGGGSIGLWDVAERQSLSELLTPGEGFTALAFSPDGQTLATAGGAVPIIRLWNLATGQPRTSLVGHDAMVTSVAFSPDGRALAATAVNGSLRLWLPGSGQEVFTWDQGSGAGGQVAFTPDGAALLAGGTGGIFRWIAPRSEPHSQTP